MSIAGPDEDGASYDIRLLKSESTGLLADRCEGAPRRGRPSAFDQRRLQVLGAASQIFSAMGFRQATLEDVAETVGFTRTALYHYATSKAELLTQCTQIAVEFLDDAVARALQEPTGARRLRAFFRLYCEISGEGFGRCFALTDLCEIDDAAREMIRRQRARLARSVAGMVKLGIADGTIRDCDARLVSSVLLATFNDVARCRLNGTGEKPAELADAIFNLWLDGLSPRTPQATPNSARGNAVELG